ncbi:DUF11 domain-containing protein [Patescibacteria group bacterium]|nr:DUF11 domain-containing protein [Patescibacteria group bacterium]MBU1472546.1 DUF11 domain-containing protein [Patescibacteria group bacterium]MBU2460080.1 DUF11 domain-containing protein [Patescibacteria group bacterium]MBU2544649.1 DUF11 domain-containing protein [Patescibacteria group bacterium]
MNTKYLVLSLFVFTAGLLFSAPSRVLADCTTQYGGTTTCTPTDLTINKEVQNPISNIYVENLGSTDATFSPEGQVHFQLTVKNSSGQTFNPVNIRDVFPEHLTFVSGPGTYDKDTRTLIFQMENLIAGETRRVEITAKVLPAGSLPRLSFFCETNSVYVSSLNRNDGDTAQFCVTTSVLGVPTLPVAGFDDLALLLPFAGVGLGGLALLRKRK